MSKGAITQDLLAWQQTKSQQLMLLAISLLTLPVVYVILEVPKHVINHALDEGGFEAVQVLIWQLEQRNFLLALCAVFLLGVCLQAGLKYGLNLRRGRLAEERLYSLRNHLLRRHPLLEDQQKRALIPVVVRELEVIAGFSAEMLVTPVFQGGVFLTTLVFLFMQNVLLGSIALMLLPLQLGIIPRLQRRINKLNAERARQLRLLSERMGASNTQIKRLLSSTAQLREIRLAMNRRKFLIKGHL